MTTLTTDLQLCTFRVGDLLLGVNVVEVQEVLRYEETTAVPLAPPVVTGLINLRGQIVTAIDLRKRLDMAPMEGDRQPMSVLVRTGSEVVCLLVDAIGDVVEPDVETFEPPPPTVDERTRELIQGSFKLDSELLLLLDIDRTVTLDGM